MGMFDQAKDLYKLRAQAKKLQKALADELIEVEADGDNIVITIAADQKIKKVEIKPEATSDPVKMGDTLVRAFNKAVETSQQIAAKKMKNMGGFPGLGM